MITQSNFVNIKSFGKKFTKWCAKVTDWIETVITVYGGGVGISLTWRIGSKKKWGIVSGLLVIGTPHFSFLLFYLTRVLDKPTIFHLLASSE
jgi:CHASE2 domain-containing sensor protein